MANKTYKRKGDYYVTQTEAQEKLYRMRDATKIKRKIDEQQQQHELWKAVPLALLLAFVLLVIFVILPTIARGG